MRYRKPKYHPQFITWTQNKIVQTCLKKGWKVVVSKFGKRHLVNGQLCWVPRRSEKILEHPSCQNRFCLPRRFNVLGGTAPSSADFAESCAFQLRHLTPVCLYGVIIQLQHGLAPPTSSDTRRRAFRHAYLVYSTSRSALHVSQRWPDAFRNKLLASAVIDRLKGNAYEIILTGKSYRQTKSQNKSIEKTKEV